MTRFTSAELAAETYRQMVRAIGESGLVTDGELVAPADAAVFGPVRQETARLGDLKRFASLPHYNEASTVPKTFDERIAFEQAWDAKVEAGRAAKHEPRCNAATNHEDACSWPVFSVPGQ